MSVYTQREWGAVNKFWGNVNARDGAWREVEKAILQGVPPDYNDNQAIITASANGNYKIVKGLSKFCTVRAGARDNEALVRAVERGHVAVVEFLLSLPGRHGVDINARGSKPLRVACKHRDFDMVKALLLTSQALLLSPSVEAEVCKVVLSHGGSDMQPLLQQCRRWSPLRAAWLTAAMLGSLQKMKGF